MSELDIETVRKGDDRTYPRKGNTVRIHYSTQLATGEVIDVTRARSQPFSFQVGSADVIEGLEETVRKMSLGEKVTVKIPPHKAYGKEGVAGRIPPNCMLLMQVELLAVI